MAGNLVDPKMSGDRVIVVAMTYYISNPEWSDQYEPDDAGWDDDPGEPAPALSLAPAQRVALGAAVEAGMRERGCDNTLRAARQWAAGAGLDWAPLQAQLEGRGGYCDCEILFNVLPPESPSFRAPGER